MDAGQTDAGHISNALCDGDCSSPVETHIIVVCRLTNFIHLLDRQPTHTSRSSAKLWQTLHRYLCMSATVNSGYHMLHCGKPGASV